MNDFGGGDGAQLRRRELLSLAGVGFAAAACPALAWSEAPPAPGQPMLATPDQIAAERLALRFIKDPDLPGIQQKIKAALSQGVTGRTAAGAATIDHAIAEWTLSLLFMEISKHRRHPAILWGVDNTPRTWLGHTLPGVGMSGDNPDGVMRGLVIDGSKQYELLGWRDGANPSTQLVIEFVHADPTQPASLMDFSSNKPRDIAATLKVLTDRDLTLGPDGGFRLMLGGEGEGPDHVALKPGWVTLAIRDIFADWRQKPTRLTIRETGAPLASLAEPLDYELIKRNTLADLPNYIGLWGRYPEIWMGGLAPNAASAPLGRNGGWGFVAGVRFDLQPDEAFLLTTGTGNAAYTGIELNDPWMIMPNAARHQVSLNKSQVTPNADGTVTYVISQADAGAANWLDTVGVNGGLCVLRWTVMPPGATGDGLMRDHKVVKLSELAGMDLPRVTPQERRRRMAERADAYSSRTRD